MFLRSLATHLQHVDLYIHIHLAHTHYLGIFSNGPACSDKCAHTKEGQLYYIYAASYLASEATTYLPTSEVAEHHTRPCMCAINTALTSTVGAAAADSYPRRAQAVGNWVAAASDGRRSTAYLQWWHVITGSEV